MAIVYVMPKLAMGMNEGTINEWLIKEGEIAVEYIAGHQPDKSVDSGRRPQCHRTDSRITIGTVE